MKTQIRKILKDKGFKVGTPEWKREYERIRKTTRNPQYLERRRKKRLVCSLSPKQLEEQRAKWREKSRKRRASKQSEINRKARERYERNKESYRAEIYKGRKRRNPEHGLTKLIYSYRRGERGIDELVGSFRSALIQSHALTAGTNRGKVSKR